jgi:hypothetical protein
MLKQGFFTAIVLSTAIAAPVMTEVRTVQAHHGWSEYNNQQTLNLTGEIQSISYGNPHTAIQLKTGNQVWLAVLAPQSRMERRGLPKQVLKVGQKVRVVGYPHRTEASEMRAERIIVGDRTVELR